MNRRRVLGGLGAAGAAAAGGFAAHVATPDADLEVPDDGCPSLRRAEDGTLCYQSARGELMYLQPSRERATLPRTELSFSLTNVSPLEASTNAYAWEVWKLTEDGWTYVSISPIPMPLTPLGPLETHTWSLTVDNTEPAASIHPRDHENVQVPFLGPGLYAFGIPVDGTGYVALFELQGPELTLPPLPDAETTWDGDSVTVRESDADVSFVAMRDRDADAAEWIIPEVAARFPLYRGTLPYLRDEAERVRYVGRRSALFAEDRDEWTVAYREETYTFRRQ